METTEQIAEAKTPIGKPLLLPSDELNALCSFSYASNDHCYTVLLEADTEQVSLEGMNKFLITVSDNSPASPGKFRTELEINLRQEMNAVSIEGDSPYYFTISDKSLDLTNPEIDSSIQDVVDLGVMGRQINSGVRSGNEQGNQALLLDTIAIALVKASISTLLAQSTLCHKQVIQNAGHLFASRQDYIRDMCRCISSKAELIATSVANKTRLCEQSLF